jgi:ABC-type transport system involved in multi-copper enzyme maturation permease subunit
MTTTTTEPQTSPGWPAASLPPVGDRSPSFIHLVRAEFLKIRTTNAWWLLGMGALLLLALSFLFNAIGAHFLFTQATPEGMSAEDAAAFEASRAVIVQAANLYTSGQFFGLMFVMLLGILVVTNEFHHQTATTTFLTTPHRTVVILAKFVGSMLGGALLWAVTTALTVPATVLFLQSEGVPSHLGSTIVTRAILLNLLAYALWGVLGVGIGVLIRSQLGATITATAVYTVGSLATVILLSALAGWLDARWLLNLQWAVPPLDSQLMVSGANIPGQPVWWVGGVILVGWTLLTGTIGVLILRKRDIS